MRTLPHTIHKNKLKGVPWWLSGWRIWCCYGTGLLPGPRTFTCHRCSPKRKKKRKKIEFWQTKMFRWIPGQKALPGIGTETHGLLALPNPGARAGLTGIQLPQARWEPQHWEVQCSSCLDISFGRSHGVWHQAFQQTTPSWAMGFRDNPVPHILIP